LSPSHEAVGGPPMIATIDAHISSRRAKLAEYLK
jgi:hypothetical protein